MFVEELKMYERKILECLKCQDNRMVPFFEKKYHVLNQLNFISTDQ